MIRVKKIMIHAMEGFMGEFYDRLNMYPVAPNHARFWFVPADDNVDPIGESWLIYKENGLYGYKDRSGKVMIKAQFDGAAEFSQGIARVYDRLCRTLPRTSTRKLLNSLRRGCHSKSKTACAYIDTTGKLLTPYGK
ncbi:WG repeat-containing protein, partial [Desulfolucanica intricata]|uniref:WG repeat-containing protein n=1 Tax=Desulfolucanica intricata TaxID=1285191 RepID=UPI000AA86141